MLPLCLLSDPGAFMDGLVWHTTPAVSRDLWDTPSWQWFPYLCVSPYLIETNCRYTLKQKSLPNLFIVSKKGWSERCSVVSDFLRPHGLYGLLQARILEWVAFPFSRGSSQPKDQTQVSCIAGGFFTSWPAKRGRNGKLALWTHHQFLSLPGLYCSRNSWGCQATPSGMLPTAPGH